MYFRFCYCHLVFLLQFTFDVILVVSIAIFTPENRGLAVGISFLSILKAEI